MVVEEASLPNICYFVRLGSENIISSKRLREKEGMTSVADPDPTYYLARIMSLFENI